MTRYRLLTYVPFTPQRKLWKLADAWKDTAVNVLRVGLRAPWFTVGPMPRSPEGMLILIEALVNALNATQALADGKPIEVVQEFLV